MAKTYKTVLGEKVELTPERKRHILERHPDISPYLDKISKVLLESDQIRVDKRDANVLLFYKYFSKIGKGKYLVIVIKINKRNFILTFYSTYKIKTGEKYEQK